MYACLACAAIWIIYIDILLSSHYIFKTLLYLSLPVAFACLINILGDVLFLQFAHALDLIQINHEAGIVRVMQSDALSAEHGQVIWAIEVLHTILMLTAELLLQSILVVLACTTLFKVEVSLWENGVFLNNLVKDIDV